MKQYIEIKVKGKSSVVNGKMAQLYNLLHLRLVTLDMTSVGVSWPTTDTTLGSVIRLHGDHSSLNSLMSVAWYSKMESDITVGKILDVPSGVNYAIIRRIQPKMSLSKMKRLIKRGNDVNPKQYKIDMCRGTTSLPFLDLLSFSTKRVYRLFVTRDIVTDNIVGEFNSQGLSKGGTVPWF